MIHHRCAVLLGRDGGTIPPLDSNECRVMGMPHPRKVRHWHTPGEGVGGVYLGYGVQAAEGKGTWGERAYLRQEM